MQKEGIRLDALSRHQRRLVERHAPLVRLVLQRHYLAMGSRTVLAMREDLLQEGMIALVSALRSHDPARHGAFVPHAFSRIRHAISRTLSEDGGAVHIPYIASRRRRAGGSKSGHPLPVCRRSSHEAAMQAASDRRIQRHSPNPADHPSDPPRLGDVLRSRLAVAHRNVVAAMKRHRGLAPGTRALIDRCAEERWSVPEPSSQTGIRRLAREMNCSLGRITHCESRYRARMRTVLRSDPVFQLLENWSRHRKHGLEHRLSPREQHALRAAAGSAPGGGCCVTRRGGSAGLSRRDKGT